MLPIDFDYREYLLLYPDLVKAGLTSKKAAEKHYKKYGKAEGRPYKRTFNLEKKLSAEDVHSQPKVAEQKTDQRICIILHTFYEELLPELTYYINRLPFVTDIYLTSYSDQSESVLKGLLHLPHNIQRVEIPKYGLDIGPFFAVLEHLKKQEKTYDYYLKIHSKKNVYWRRPMLEACLPQEGIETVFAELERQHMTGSEQYLFSLNRSHLNKEFILEQIKTFDLPIQETTLYDTIKESTGNETFDPLFYGQYHQDIRVNFAYLEDAPKERKQKLIEHYEAYGQYEAGRCRNISQLEQKAEGHFAFFAGTMFWFDQEYLDYLLKHTDSFAEIAKRIETEKTIVVNTKPTYTHHLEYWFGILASHMNKEPLRGFRSIGILVAPEYAERHPETIQALQKTLEGKRYHVQVELCSQTDDAPITHDVYIGIGWQALSKLLCCKQHRKPVCLAFDEKHNVVPYVRDINELCIWLDEQADKR